MVRRIIGVIVLLLGTVFFFQGIGALVIGNSVMTNNRTWVILGPVIALCGIALIFWRRRPAP